MQGSILQISISPGGLPKCPIAEGRILPFGLEGDGHAHPQIHGGPRKAILIVASEAVEELKARGYPLFYGALGENLTTRGLEMRDLRIGDHLRAGGTVLEITQPREPCSALDVYGEFLKREIYDQRVKAGDYTSPLWGMSGFKASVVRAGPVRLGDIIAIVATSA